MSLSLSPRKVFGLPLCALLGALVLASVAALCRSSSAALSELQIGLIAWSLLLGVFGVQGLVADALDGSEPRPGMFAPHPSTRLGVAIALGCVLLVGVAGLLGGAILSDQPVAVVGTLAGTGFLLLAYLLGAYKRAFVGNEVRIDPRRDGIPW